MIKRAMIKPVDGGLEADPSGGSVWLRVGRQLCRRRIQLGFDVDYVASHLEVSPAIYQGYEGGIQAPAFMLSQIADLFGVPVVSFFQDVVREVADSEDTDTAQPAVYRVATPEYREQVLTECFRGLDLEDQQYLLALSKALSKAKARQDARLTG